MAVEAVVVAAAVLAVVADINNVYKYLRKKNDRF